MQSIVMMDLFLHIYFQSQQCNAFSLVIFVHSSSYISRNLSVMIIKLVECVESFRKIMQAHMKI